MWKYLAFKAARSYFGKDFWDDAERLVKGLLNANLTGEQKREEVRKLLKKRWVMAKTSTINAVLEMVLQKVKRDA